MGNLEGVSKSEWRTDSRVRHRAGLELGQSCVHGCIQSNRGSDGGHGLRDQKIQIRGRWSFDTNVSTTDVGDGLVIRDIGVLEENDTRMKKRGIRLVNDSLEGD